MCLLERRESTIKPIDMTLAERLLPHNACVDIAANKWPCVTLCPNCNHEVQLSISACGKELPAHSPTRIPQLFLPSPLQLSSQPPLPFSEELRQVIKCGKGPPSPHTPIHTIQPMFLPTALPSPQPITPSPYTEELRRLAETLRALRLSGWYYGNLDWQGARNMLKDASVGAFVVRDSRDRNFIFSLSVQTERGPTSVRLHYEFGFFRLDCDRPLARYMPRFRCVVELVQHYTRIRPRAAAGTVWVDRDGCPHSPVLLKNPVRQSPPSLLHCARMAIHKTLDSNPVIPKLWCAPKHRLLPLPSTLIDYLGEYPYSI